MKPYTNKLYRVNPANVLYCTMRAKAHKKAARFAAKREIEQAINNLRP